MNKKITFEILTENQVVVKTINTTVIEGNEYQIGQPITRCYINSTRGREEIKALPENIQSIILSMWGDKPTVVENATA